EGSEGGGYLAAAERLWRDVTERKLYITGGLGAVREYEGFAYGYCLPNSGYLETCAGVGLAFWAGRMGEAFGRAAYADVYERALYNNILVGVSLAGDRYTYQNPLEARGGSRRWAWHGCPCCPPMLLKAVAGLGDQIYAHASDEAGDDLFVHHYVGGSGKFALPGGEVELVQRAAYVWDGRVQVTLRTLGPRTFGLHLRLPGWCQTLELRLNGAALEAVEMQDGYAVIRREWQNGDTIDLEMAMAVQRLTAHPYASHLRYKVALQRGPLVYCLEGIDNPGAAKPTLAAEPHLAARHDPDLLGGVTVIQGLTGDGRNLLAIPYFAWDNRAPAGEEQDWMQVWLGQTGLEEPSLAQAGDLTGWEHRLYRPLPV
ncbi:MAG: glycoside hydrolase family 127 protein, partial [Caldilineaceae bacterium]|nr:glycoside hydrolase family 127 protein [Caldilineaceae bacterium]